MEVYLIWSGLFIDRSAWVNSRQADLDGKAHLLLLCPTDVLALGPAWQPNGSCSKAGSFGGCAALQGGSSGVRLQVITDPQLLPGLTNQVCAL